MSDSKYIIISLDEYNELIKENEELDKALLKSTYLTRMNIEKRRQLEKAFDKACEELESQDTKLHYFDYGEESFTKEQWKEWCLEND